MANKLELRVLLWMGLGTPLGMDMPKHETRAQIAQSGQIPANMPDAKFIKAVFEYADAVVDKSPDRAQKEIALTKLIDAEYFEGFNQTTLPDMVAAIEKASGPPDANVMKNILRCTVLQVFQTHLFGKHQFNSAADLSTIEHSDDLLLNEILLYTDLVANKLLAPNTPNLDSQIVATRSRLQHMARMEAAKRICKRSRRISSRAKNNWRNTSGKRIRRTIF